MKNKLVILALLFGIIATYNAQNIPIEKFLGIWNADDESWSSRRMKISQENGEIIVQIKGLIDSEATLNGNRLEITVVDEINYGQFWIGSWGGWYDSDHDWVPERSNYILVGHGDGNYGTNGAVGGYYSSNHRKKANKEVSYLSVHVVYKHEGTLELYFTYHSIYYYNDEPLF